jgi:rubrerythrin
MIRLDPKVLDGLDTLDGLRDALQQAVELEHATIPPYLYAYYSFNDPSGQVPQLIRSVVIEEMGHMSLACNMLNAIGGHPSIDDPSFVPKFPGPLPGGVETGFEVGLAPFSLDLVEKVFMEIEEPEHRVDVGGAPPDPGAVGVTIGEFYDAIEAAIEQLPSSSFSGAPGLQVTNSDPEVIAVSDVASAKHAIGIIKDQGEGTSQSPVEAGTDTPAHYYRFAEIVAGKALQQDASGQWSYSGAAITFQPGDVLPLPTNPHASEYTGAVKDANDTFNKDYTALLTSLHTVFNGSPDSLGEAIGAMFKLTTDAQAVTAAGGGPTFEYSA